MLRVIQWATGSVGRHAVAAVHEHPDLELAGALVYSDAKAGRDVGDICGIGPVGVTTTTDPDEIAALDADCVLYMPQGEMNPMGAVDDICRLLASGKNVVSTAVTGLIYPRSLGDKVVDKLESACAEGQTSFHATGIEPATRRSPRTARTKPIRAAWAPPCTPSTPSLRSARLRRESVRSLTFR
jgi:2,4-diaminopentanoate dehydrogenase